MRETLFTFAVEKRIYLFLFGIILFVLAAWFAAPPRDFPTGSIITISQGTGLYALSKDLEAQKVIRSPFWFRTSALFLGGERDMKAGQYYLSRKQNPFVLAWRILHGRYEIETIKLTVPEGFTVKEISRLFDEKNFPFFDNAVFERSAPEGFLFPDTYFMPVTATATSTIKFMRDNFIRKIFPVMGEVEESGNTLEEIITMASIIERETNTSEGREIVSGILWKRIRLGLPLQVDATFSYVNGKTTAQLTQEDLKINSPYNTYVYTGLPPGPIANPGLESIKAALNPKTTPYLYFLTGRDGNMHYARTFDEHIINKQQYLN